MQSEQAFLPKHVAIIPDGNRRWAKERGLDPWVGHEEGAKIGEKLIERAHEIGIHCLSFWGSSMDNLTKRPLDEKKALLRIYNEYFRKLLADKKIHEHETRISILGRWRELFPQELVVLLERAEEETKHYSKNFLNFFLAYNGDEEMLSAVRSIVALGSTPEQVSADLMKKNLYTRDLPPVDYLIRTGGEPHLSAGFMMWDIANAQLYFSEALYPDFGPEQLSEAIEEYQRRERRLGK